MHEINHFCNPILGVDPIKFKAILFSINHILLQSITISDVFVCIFQMIPSVRRRHLQPCCGPTFTQLSIMMSYNRQTRLLNTSIQHSNTQSLSLNSLLSRLESIRYASFKKISIKDMFIAAVIIKNIPLICQGRMIAGVIHHPWITN